MNKQPDLFGPSLTDAKDKTFLDARRPKGTHCPLCTHFVKVYPRKLNSGMAYTLMNLYHWDKYHTNEFIHLQRYCSTQYNHAAGDRGKLVWWGMIEKSDAPPEKGEKSNGLYRMTQKGRDFVERKFLVIERCIEYLSKIEYFYGDQVDIVHCLGSHFNYRELMRGSPPF